MVPPPTKLVRTPSKPGVWDMKLPPPVKVMIIHYQKARDVPRITATFRAIQGAAPNATAQAHLLAACRKESGACLHALLIAFLGLRMEDKAVREAMELCLGATVCTQHECHLCGGTLSGLH